MWSLPVPRWLAALACLIASAVPAAGLVLCVHDGELEFGVGDHCPCELPDDHPDCDHIDLTGGGEPVGPVPRVAPAADAGPGPAPAMAAGVPRVSAVVPAKGGREPPPGVPAVSPWHGSADLPWVARHLGARRTTSLLV